MLISKCRMDAISFAPTVSFPMPEDGFAAGPKEDVLREVKDACEEWLSGDRTYGNPFELLWGGYFR